MSEIKLIEQSPKKNSSDKALFNSILFIDLDSIYDHYSDNSYEKDLNDSNEINSIDNEFFLIKELIEELDSPNTVKEEKEDNPINSTNSLLSLINNGYEFIPKGFKNYGLNNNKSNKKPILYNKYNMKNQNENKNCLNIKNKTIKEKKGDWICLLCHNLNFAFRTRCNRCKAPKKECIKK